MEVLLWLFLFSQLNSNQGQELREKMGEEVLEV